MSHTEQAAEGSSAEAVVAQPNLLENVLNATKQTPRDQAQELVKTAIEQALAGTLTFDRNLSRSFDRAIALIDEKLSAQLNEIMHHPRFLKLEGSWRGLN